MARLYSSVAARAVVAVNANASRSGDPEQLLATILAAAGGAGGALSGFVTEDEDDLREAIAEADGGRLVVAGGDGAVHFALNAAEGPLEIGLVPTGRANNIARTFGLPRDVPRAARVAVTAPARPVDVLRVETPSAALYGVEGVSAGLHADARMRYTAEDSSHLLEGAGAFVRAVQEYQPWRFELELDRGGAQKADAAALFLSNLPLFAYGFRIDPGAQVDDGRLEAILLESSSRRGVARLLVDAYRGTLDRRASVSVTPAREAVIASPVPVVCDSVPLGMTTAAVRVEQGRLAIATSARAGISG